MLIGKLLDVRKTSFWNAGSTPAVRHHKRFRRLTPLMSKRQRLPSNRLGISRDGGCYSLSKTLTFLFLYGGSLIGKAADSKSVRCRFDPDPSCHRILNQAPQSP